MSRRGQQLSSSHGGGGTKTDRLRHKSPSGGHHRSSGAGHESRHGGGRGGKASPLRSKLMAMAMSGLEGEEGGGGSRGRKETRGDDRRGRGDAGGGDHGSSRYYDQHDNRDRDRGDRRVAAKHNNQVSPPRRLRMDEQRSGTGREDNARGGVSSGARDRDRDHYQHSRSSGHPSTSRGELLSAKKKSELDRAVKRAREDDRSSSFWQKKILEEEEKHPERWGHSGFKELYKKDFRSRSRSFNSRSRSRSPLGGGKISAKKRLAGRKSRSTSPRGTLRRRSPLSTKRNSNGSSHQPTSTSNRGERHLHSRGGRDASGKAKGGSDALGKHRRGHRSSAGLGGHRHSDSSQSPSPSKKRSRTSGGLSSSKRHHGSPTSPRTAAKKAAKRVAAGKKPLDSDSLSSTSSISSSSDNDDEDVLQLHAKGRGSKRSRHRQRKGSFSYSDSSDSDSSSGASAELRIKRKRKQLRGGVSSTSSSSSSLSSESESDEEVSSDDSEVSIRQQKKGKGATVSSAKRASSVSSDSSMSSKASGTLINKHPPPPTSTSGVTGAKKGNAGQKKEVQKKSSPEKKVTTTTAEPKSSTKQISSTSGQGSGAKVAKASGAAKNGPSSTTGGTPKKVVKEDKKEKPKASQVAPASKAKSKSPPDSGETDTSTGESSSDSDSEPKMTLSERFAKLTQATVTDKREFAKPLLSLNEIDTKLKVVKDLRNADTKIFVDGQPPQVSSSSAGPRTAPRIRPRTPDYNNEGDRRYNSDERRRTFERMTRDEPSERPADWSDSGVRYRYYRDRGYFKDRPCSFDEFLKWEEWWYKYRDWLAQEGYYNQQEREQGYPPPSSSSGYHHQGPPAPQQAEPQEWGHHPHPQQPPPPQQIVGLTTRHGHQYHHQNNPHRDIPGVGGGGFVPLSSRANFGRPDGSAYLQAGVQSNIRRRIGRTTNGSLVVNIRQGGGGEGGGLRGLPVVPQNGFRSASAQQRLQQQQQAGHVPPHQYQRR